MAKFGLKPGDQIIVRAAAPRDQDGKILFIPAPDPKPRTVTKVWDHGVRCKNWGYCHNKCIISKVEEQQ